MLLCAGVVLALKVKGNIVTRTTKKLFEGNPYRRPLRLPHRYLGP